MRKPVPIATSLRSSRVPPMTSRVPAGLVFKVFLLASVSVIGSAWALVRFYTHPRAPMVVPATEIHDAGSGAKPDEIPAPDLEPSR